MHCTAAEMLNQSVVYWKTVIQVVSIVLQLQEKVSKALVLLTRNWIALSTGNKWQGPQESGIGRSALEPLPRCFAGSSEFPSPPQWYNLTAHHTSLVILWHSWVLKAGGHVKISVVVTAKQTSTLFFFFNLFQCRNLA